MNEPTTDDTRAALAALLEIPVDDVLHYAITVHTRQGMLTNRFCGMPDDGIALYAAAIRALAINREDYELMKLAAGCTACHDTARDK